MRRSGRRSTRSTRNPRNNGLRATVVNVGRFFEICIEGQEGVLEVKVYKTTEAKISHSAIFMYDVVRPPQILFLRREHLLQILSPVMSFLKGNPPRANPGQRPGEALAPGIKLVSYPAAPELISPSQALSLGPSRGSAPLGSHLERVPVRGRE